jgi:hypothetical protein
MKRLLKQAEGTNSEVINIGKAINDNSESGPIITNFVDNWLEYKLEEIDDLDEKVIYEKFDKEINEDPDELFEKVIDLVPEEGDDEKLYNANPDEKRTVVEMLLESNYDSIMEVIRKAVEDEELIRSENA